MITLRPYQADGLESLRAKIGRGHRKIVLVGPTAMGKTTIASAMIKGAIAKGKRSIFLAHRQELIAQCSARLDELEVPHGIFQGQHPRFNPERPVQVASVQTLINRDHWPADLIVVDECHRSTSPTYVKILKRYINPVIIGLTATPYRMDGRGLGELYSDLYEVATTQELIDLGYLIEPVIYGSARPDLSDVGSQAGDYKKSELGKAMEPLILHGQIVKNWIAKFEERDACTVIFAASISQSKMIVEQFNAHGITGAHIDGNTPDAERKRILGALRNREIKIVSNYGILTEGWDLPHLECVVLARPTRSRSLFRQMIGRLMRPDPGKRFATVLDHAGCHYAHGFVTEPEEYSLEGREKRTRKGDADSPVKECTQCLVLLPIQAAVCPECGYEFPKRGIQHTDEDLVRLTKENLQKKKRTPKDERQKQLEQLCLKCMDSSFKPNWAKVRYLHIFGEWPSWNQGLVFPKFFREYERQYAERVKADQGQSQAS